MRRIEDGHKYEVGLDFEESLDGFIDFLNWLSIVPYAPAITVSIGAMAGAVLRLVRPKTAGRVAVILFAVNLASVRWLEQRFASPIPWGKHPDG